MRSETPTSRRIQKARTALVLDHPFFGSLLFRLKDCECRSIETMATDGVSLYYNPEFVETLNAATLAGTLAHEVMHPALHHHVRRSGRDPKRWNVACDFAINPLLVDAGLSLPEGILLDNRFRGMSAEQIYNLLETEAGQDPSSEHEEGESGGEGSNAEQQAAGDANKPSAPRTEGGIGQVLDAPAPDEDSPTTEEQEREWNIAVNQAATIAKHAGKVPAGLNRTLEGAAEAAVDWRELLRRHWSDTIPADYSWMRPNRRHLWTGLYLPGVVREGVGEVAIAVDCSGSVSGRQLRLFEAEVRSILEGHGRSAFTFSTSTRWFRKWRPTKPGSALILTQSAEEERSSVRASNGWTTRGIRPQTLVFLTDLYGSFPASRSLLSRPVGFDREPKGAIRRGHSHASGLTQAS